MSIIQKEYTAFKYAIQGIQQFLIKEDHGKFHLFATIVVVPILLFLNTTATEKALLFIIIALVWGMEMLNSAIEKTLDFMTSRHHPEVKYIKDVMAGAVLVASCCSIIIGSIILLPKIYNYVF
jgi:diacylglycerol kinase (ATP)